MISSEETQEPLIQQLDPEVVSDFMPFYWEALEKGEEQDLEALQEVLSDLTGDLRFHDAFVAKANEDLEVAHSVAYDILHDRGQDAAPKIEKKGYAKTAPRFIDQVTDESRQNKFSYIDGEETVHPRPEDIKQTTEVEGLQQLYGFLADFYNDTRPQKGVDNLLTLSERAKSMIEKLSFIGERELQEASYGMAEYWKNYLDEDPNNQICVLASVSDSARYQGERKSDEYIRDRILRTFTDEELEKYSGRIVGELEDITADTENTKVVLMDDWSISGRELRTVYDELLVDDKFYELATAERVEIDLIVSSQGRIENGFKLNPSYDANLPAYVPVKSYYRSHFSGDSLHEHKGHVTGTHSSVNYDFDKEVGRTFPRALGRLMRVRKAVSGVALANVVPPYYTDEPKIEIEADQLTRVGRG